MAVAVKKGVFIVAGKRTPFGKYGGLLRDVLAEDLFATAATAALKASSVAPDLVDTVNIGQISPVSQTGLSPRHASLKAGIPVVRPVLGLNRLSGSAFNAIICSAQEILIGASQISLAGGMEAMSSTPFLVRDVRFGTARGKNYEMEDYLRMVFIDTYCNMFLWQTADTVAAEYGITRREADEFALRSQQRWKQADASGFFNEEIAPVPVKIKNREVLMTTDEYPQPDTTIEKLSKLTPLSNGGITTPGNATVPDASGFFNEEIAPVPVKIKNREVLMTTDEYPQPDTTIEKLSKLTPLSNGGITTPGNATGINDGAAAMILVNEQALKDHSLKPLARLVGWSCVAVDPMRMGTAAIPAAQTVLQKTGLTMNDMDLVEIHETYAATTLVCARELAVDETKLNVNGGAIAIGHPSGATGARIMSHLTHELRRRGLRRALASASIAGGQGIAMIIETV